MALPDWVDVVPVQPPGRENRIGTTPFAAVRDLVDSAHDGLAGELSPPFAFFGHSLGALVAYELAAKLAAGGSAGPVVLFASAHRAPHLPLRRKPIHHKRDRAFLRSLRNLGTIPAEVLDHHEMRALLLPTLRADFTMFETYRHTAHAPLSCPIVAIGGAADPLVPIADLDAWAQHTTAPATTRVLPGGHFYLFDHRSNLLDLVARDLRRAVEQR